MTEFYCIKCQRLYSQQEAKRVFQTGFIRVHGMDVNLGLCTQHEEVEVEDDDNSSTNELRTQHRDGR